MTTKEILLVQLAEELGEVQHSIHKALRFGLGDTNPKTGFSNAEDINNELTDVVAVLYRLKKESIYIEAHSTTSDYFAEKTKRIEDYLQYSTEKGLIDEK